MTVRSKIVRQDMEDGGTGEGKRSGGWEKGIRRGQTGKVSTFIDSMRQSFLLNYACLPMHGTV